MCLEFCIRSGVEAKYCFRAPTYSATLLVCIDATKRSVVLHSLILQNTGESEK